MQRTRGKYFELKKLFRVERRNSVVPPWGKEAGSRVNYLAVSSFILEREEHY